MPRPRRAEPRYYLRERPDNGIWEIRWYEGRMLPYVEWILEFAGKHREEIRARIAAIAGVPLGAVSIKATTTEKLGFVGRAEGLAAQAAATVRLPEEDGPALDAQAETAMRQG